MFRRLFWIVLLGFALSVPVPANNLNKPVYGPIKRNDTLWNIAERVKPASNLSTQQVIMAVYNKNKHAFTVNNINSLRKDAYILAPTLAEVQQYSRNSAIAMVKRHNSRWKRGRYVRIDEKPPAQLTQLLNARKQASNQSQTQPPPASPAGPPPKPATAAVTEQQTAPAAQAVQSADFDNKPLQEQVQILKQELAQTRQENARLNNELTTLKAQKSGAAVNPDVQAQLDALRYELAELRTILGHKDNHIKTLQASLKSASEAIKSQHADNMRLYNKLRELSPESVPARAESGQSKPPQLQLASVIDNEVSQTNTGNNTTNAPATKPGTVWADEVQAVQQSANSNTNTTAAPSAQGTMLANQQATNGVSSSAGIPLDQLIAEQRRAQQQDNYENNHNPFFNLSGRTGVSPIAWLAVLMSFLFILFLVVRSLLMQNEIRRRFEHDEDNKIARIA